MKMSLIAQALFTGLLLGILITDGWAQKRSDRPQKQKRVEQMYKHRAMLGALDLSEEQKEQIKQIMLNNRQEVLPLHNRVREKTARLRTLRTADNVNMNTIEQTVDELTALRADIMKQRLSAEQEIRQILEDDQRVIFDSRRGILKHITHRHYRS